NRNSLDDSITEDSAQPGAFNSPTEFTRSQRSNVPMTHLSSNSSSSRNINVDTSGVVMNSPDFMSSLQLVSNSNQNDISVNTTSIENLNNVSTCPVPSASVRTTNPTSNSGTTTTSRPVVSCSRSNPFAHLSTTITGSVPSGIISGGLAGSLAGLGVLDTSDLNNHVLFYLCGRCVSFDSFDADSVKVHLDLECPGMRNKWARTSE
ncbi:hypothetical protein FHG87_019032, partial [Trinorchestia longiramus]